MKILLKKVFIVLLAFLVLLASSSRFLVRPVQAQEWYDQNPFEFFTKVYDPSNSDEIFGERYTAAQVQWVLWGLLWAAWPFKPFIYCILTQDIGACISCFSF
jgi:hypothetical protein